MKYCPGCGCENLDESVFCRNCGFKFNMNNADSQKNIVDTNDSVSIPAHNVGTVKSIINTLFYKTDKYTGELRIAKTKSISIAVFVTMVLFAVASPYESSPFAMYVFVLFCFGLLFALPTFIVGSIIGFVIDKLTH